MSAIQLANDKFAVLQFVVVATHNFEVKLLNKKLFSQCKTKMYFTPLHEVYRIVFFQEQLNHATFCSFDSYSA